MRRAFKWVLWTLAGLLAGFALLVGVALWSLHQRGADFARLPAGERQLAIFDAFAAAVDANYFDREFIEKKWQPLRTEWRLKAARMRSDAELYDQVFLPLSQLLPSSHIAALPPPTLLQAQRASRAQSGVAPMKAVDRGFIIASVRRGLGTAALVDELVPGSPAMLAGVEPGWIVRSLPGGLVDHETGVFLDVGSPALRLRTELEDSVTLTDPDIHSQAEFDAKYLRSVSYAFIEPRPRAPFEARYMGDSIYVRFDSFQYPQVIDQVISALDKAGSGGVVLDLRGNHGGLVSEELRLAGKLLGGNTLVGAEITRSQRKERRAAATATKFTGPLVVIIGPSTASAAEVVAAALQDHGRARLLGRRTAGSTLTSDSFPLPDGGSAQVAYADFQRANGRRIEGIGVLPDVGVMPTNAEARVGRDPALDRAIEELHAAGKVTAAPGSRPPPG